MPQNYKCLVGINYPPGNKRAGAGSIVGDLSPQSVAALTAPNPVCIEPTNEPVNIIDDMAGGSFAESLDTAIGPPTEATPEPAHEPESPTRSTIHDEAATPAAED